MDDSHLDISTSKSSEQKKPELVAGPERVHHELTGVSSADAGAAVSAMRRANTRINDGVTIVEEKSAKGGDALTMLGPQDVPNKKEGEPTNLDGRVSERPDALAGEDLDRKLDTAVSNLGSEKSEEMQKQAQKDLQAAGIGGLEALLRNQAFRSSDQKIQSAAREIVDQYIKDYLRKNPGGTFSKALKEWNDEKKGLPKSMAEDLPRGLLEFAALVNHPAVKGGEQAGDKNSQVLVKAIGESVTKMTSYRGDTDQTVAAALPYLPNLKELTLGDSEVDPPKITTDALKSVKELKHLERLSLDHIGLTGKELKTIEGMDSIKSVLLFNDPITDAAVAPLAKLKNLEALALEGTQVSAHGFDELSKTKNFKAIVLSGFNVTDEWLTSIGKMTDLNRLQINDGAITDAGLQSLAALKNLSWLRLNGDESLTDQAVKTVAKLPLTKLEMLAPKITESPINATLLGGMTHLKELEIRGSEEYQRRIEKTRAHRQLPEIEINLVKPEPK